jgi:molecular chaperone DnaK
MSLILGIDLGTTNSLVGVVDSGFPILLADADGERLTPSVASYGADGSVTVGRPALRRRALEPERTVTSVKRLIGRRAGEGAWRPPYDLGKIGVTPVEVSAAILQHLRGIAERAMEQTITRAVITVPAYFNDAQRGATIRAGQLAGLTVERIVIAVFDLGGGTFDVSILELHDGVFEVLATAGDTQLGGDDVDQMLAEWLWEQAAFPGAPAFDALPVTARVRLIEAAEAAKKRLSSEDRVEVAAPFLWQEQSLALELTRADLEKLAAPWAGRTRKHCLRALADAGLRSEDLDRVILVGGSTRMPLVRRAAAEIFGREPDVSQNPDEAVALGAVIQAGILSGALRQVLLLDVTPLSLGIETFGGLMNVIIPRRCSSACCRASASWRGTTGSWGALPCPSRRGPKAARAWACSSPLMRMASSRCSHATRRRAAM